MCGRPEFRQTRCQSPSPRVIPQTGQNRLHALGVILRSELFGALGKKSLVPVTV